MTTISNKSLQNDLSYLKIEPTQPATHSMIWLHGLGADGHDFASMATELHLSLPVRFIFPHAPTMPVSMNQGYVMPAWFDIYSDRISSKIDMDGILKSTATVQALIAAEEKAGIPSDHIIIAGFSQGALIALTAGLNYVKPIAGVIALSGYLPARCLQAQTEPRKTKVFLAHGTQDGVVPFSLGEETLEVLQQAKITVDWHSYPIVHTVSGEEVRDIGAWIEKLFA